MSSRAIKKQVLDLLAGGDLVASRRALAGLPAGDVVHALFSAICRENPVVRWHAVTCMGDAVARIAEDDLEAARIVLRRFLWSLNDESGGIGWGAPEAMAECMCRDERLAGEYAHMLVSYMREDGEELCQDGNFIEHPLLQRGVVWGIGRLAGCRRELLQQLGAGRDLGRYLEAEDPELRGLAALAAGRLREATLRPLLQGLRADTAPLSWYDEGALHQTTVGVLVRDALEELE